MQTKTWMWAHNGDTHGAEMDFEKRIIHWYDTLGCACGGASLVSSFDDYLEKGAPLNSLPKDIANEIQQAMQ